MKREIREVKDDIVQITTVDERWYVADEFYAESVPFDKEYVPSATWIADCYPKGIGFYKWLAKHGWDKAERLREEAGEHGSKSHRGIEALLKGEEVRIDSSFPNSNTGEPEELTYEDYFALMTFADWYEKFNPDVIAIERSFINEEFLYGGTLDLVFELPEPVKVWRTTYDKGLYVTDYKTSSRVWPSHEIQISSYKRGLAYMPDIMAELSDRGYEWTDAKLLILQVGYNRNKRGWKPNLIEDQFDLFLAARRIWQKEHGSESPHQAEYPVSLSLES